MLNISNVTKSFERIQALNAVNLTVARGEFFGLLGPNGAGKSTLMNLIVGYLEPDFGLITVDNESMSYENIRIREKIGYVPQDIALYSDLTAYQNMVIFGRLYELSASSLDSKIEETLELVQLSDRKKDKVKTYSGGMKRRLNLAVSLLHEPELLLCDEPTVGIDPQSRNAIFEILRNLNKKGMTIIYTTHYIEEAERLCNRLAIIDSGRIIARGTLKELINLLEKINIFRIPKTVETNSHLDLFKEIGKVTELDFYWEVQPKPKFTANSTVFKLIEDAGIPSSFVELSRVSLEDVFFNLTGRSLRD